MSDHLKSIESDLAAIEALTKFLNLSDEDRLNMVKASLQRHAPHLIPVLDVIDMPDSAPEYAHVKQSLSANAQLLDTWLLDYCAQQGVSEIPTRIALQHAPKCLRKKEVFEAAIAELAEHHLARVKSVGSKRLIEFNPLLERITNALKGGPLTQTEISHALQRHVSAAQISAALEQLQALWHVEHEIRKPEGGRGRPITLWRLLQQE